MNAIILLLIVGQCGPQGCPAPAFSAPLAPVQVALPQFASVVRVTMPDAGGRSTSLGSGSLLDSDLVVTNYHVVRDGSGRGSVAFRDGTRIGCAVIATDQPNDLAALQLASLVSTPLPIELSNGAPNHGQRLIIAGYGGDGRLTPQVGRMTTWGQYVVLSGCQSRQGDSGGPILDTSGRLCGVLWGASQGQTWGTPCGPLRRLLEGIRARNGRRGGQDGRQPAQGPANQPVRADPATQPPSLQPGEAAPLQPGWPAPIVAVPSQPQPSAPVAPTAPVEGTGQPPAVAATPSEPTGTPVAPAIAAKGDAGTAPSGTLWRWLANLAGDALPTIGTALLAGLPGGAGALLAGLATKSMLGKLLGGLQPGGLAGSIAAQVAAQIGGAVQAGVPIHSATPINPYQAPQSQPPAQVVVKGTAPATPPTFVPTQVIDPNWTAMKKALETLGSQAPSNAAWVNKLWVLQKQLLNQVTAPQGN